jgi:hypothetical protein
MAKPNRTQISASRGKLYVTREDFRWVEACADENRVFGEWVRAWTIRVEVENAIREQTPRPTRSNSSSLPPLRTRESTSPTGYFDADTLPGLADFDRFVFVLRLLERYPENECAVLLGSSRSRVREACPRANEKLARID